MTKTSRLILVIVHLGLLAFDASAAPTCSLPSGGDAVVGRLVPTIESFVLDNGLRVHLVPREHDRTVSIRVLYDVGARDEAPGRGGVAHLFEHMMFKGSGRVPDGGHFRLVRDVGGRTNAMTDYDTTQYWNTVPSAALERVVFAEADRMRSLRVTAENIANQRAAIAEEGLGLENLPYVKAATAFGLDLWRGTPYGHSPIGTPEELAETTTGEAVAFHARYYTPNNAVLVIAGGFEPRAARRLVERFFAAIPPGATRPARPPVQLDRAPRRTVASDPLAPFPVYAVVWSAVGLRDDDALPLEVLDGLLLGDPDARFTRRIVKPMTLDSYSASIFFRDVGLLNHVFVPRTFVGFDDIEDEIRMQLAELHSPGPGDEEICRSALRRHAARLRELETNEGVAAAVGRSAVFFEDPRAFEKALRRLELLDPEDVRRAARTYLIEDFHTLEIRPTGAMRLLKPILEVLPDSVGEALEEGML